MAFRQLFSCVYYQVCDFLYPQYTVIASSMTPIFHLINLIKKKTEKFTNYFNTSIPIRTVTLTQISFLKHRTVKYMELTSKARAVSGIFHLKMYDIVLTHFTESRPSPLDNLFRAFRPLTFNGSKESSGPNPTPAHFNYRKIINYTDLLWSIEWNTNGARRSPLAGYNKQQRRMYYIFKLTEPLLATDTRYGWTEMNRNSKPIKYELPHTYIQTHPLKIKQTEIDCFYFPYLESGDLVWTDATRLAGFTFTFCREPVFGERPVGQNRHRIDG